jgi:hypothetical protein
VDEGRRVEGLVALPPSPLPFGGLMELVVDEGKELVERVPVSRLELPQKAGDRFLTGAARFGQGRSSSACPNNIAAGGSAVRADPDGPLAERRCISDASSIPSSLWR